MDRPGLDAPHGRQRVHLASAIAQLRPARPGAVAERQKRALVRLGEIAFAPVGAHYIQMDCPNKLTGYRSLRAPR
jgi:hypothetical protein